MLESMKGRNLAFEELSQEEKEKRGILGRLYGPCADIAHGTRNGRKYSEALWEKVFQRPIVKEMIEAGGIPGELDHPTDRQETDSTKIAVMMPSEPVKDKDGHLVACFDIIDTPCGKIAYALAKYGFKLGISSRGNGETYIDDNGEECVDEDSYEFNAFDVVLCPSVKDARMEMITESLDKESHQKFKTEINEALKGSSDEDRKVMEETLKDLKIDYSPEKVDNKVTKEQTEVGNAEDVAVKELQESLKVQRNLENQIIALKEQLSVCNAKEATNEEVIKQYTASTSDLKLRITSLVEKYKKSLSHAESLNKTVKLLKENQRSNINSKKSLSESLNNKESEIASLKQSVKELRENLQSVKDNNEKETDSLKESIASCKKDLAIKENEFARKSASEKALIEKYKGVAKLAVDKYIACRAKMLGVDVERITEKLKPGYSFNDIDSICEGLQNVPMTLNKLPFATVNPLNENLKMKVTKSKETMAPMSGYDDNVDESLLHLAGSI